MMRVRFSLPALHNNQISILILFIVTYLSTIRYWIKPFSIKRQININRMLKLCLVRFYIFNNRIMTASFLPAILTPVVTLVFPGLCFALFFVLIEQDEIT